MGDKCESLDVSVCAIEKWCVWSLIGSIECHDEHTARSLQITPCWPRAQLQGQTHNEPSQRFHCLSGILCFFLRYEITNRNVTHLSISDENVPPEDLTTTWRHDGISLLLPDSFHWGNLSLLILVDPVVLWFATGMIQRSPGAPKSSRFPVWVDVVR